VKGDCVECPYHGWQFDGDGQCRKIPSLGKDATIPARIRVDAYPTVEKYGLVFCFLGDLPEEERPPIMDISEYGEEGWRATWQFFEWDIDYKRSVENGIDPAHNEFVHPTHGFSGENPNYKVNPLDLIETEWGTGFYNKVFAPPLAEAKMREASGRTEAAIIEAGTGHHGISSVWTHIHPTPHMKIHQYLFETPIDEDHTSLWLINMRNFMLDPEHDETAKERNAYVAGQDRTVLEDVHPVETPRTNTKEYFMPSDACVGRYRELLRVWEAAGWRIDSDTVNANQRRVAYAIPSPGRRTHKGWILDSIPLMPADEEQADLKVAGS
jgi:phenylpropionate dioxygenase-like ring-hydroxylating dioxygenase large terminal subunit